MKLLLTSAGLSNKKISNLLVSMLQKKPNECSVLLVAYAQNNNEQFYVKESKKELIDLGLSSISFFNLKESTFEETCEYDLIYVCGGNTFAILDQMRATGIDKFITDSVKSGKSIYLGVSAGSIIAGPDILIAGHGSEGDKNEIALKDLAGLALTNVSVFPHFKSHQRSEVDEFRNKVDNPVIELTDDEAVLVDEAGYRIIR
ncbi:MAG: Type 1 glutamine amidotransferase-like domain-containing protein [Patescibacteria group bacterium]